MDIREFKEHIANSNNIVFFGGAGVSTESDIPDFRSSNGLYNSETNSTYSPEEVLSHTFFMNHTEDFYKFYREKMIYANAKPNDAHKALAHLERQGKVKAIITQNIDGLHQQAGSTNVIELHGSIHRNFCMKCKRPYNLDYIIASEDIVPKCSHCSGTIKPDVVLYEEVLDSDNIDKAINYISKAEILIIGGTSLVVYPAAGLIRYFKGKCLALINKSATSYDNMANIVIKDSIGKVLSSLI
ncbi:NAD-dependent protein deacylase [Clostridium thermarum]|uniref:NAD-dependent protein deacylase n=1 Tax=Clostridium thermarum TaxID=1716543 RepID=UPI0011217C92|nr:NAD-dependent protein deacylase [Clostridium thermarum]